MTDVQAMTRAEGESLVEYLRAMPADGWDRSTACDPWTTRHLVAHMTALGNQTIGNFVRGFVLSGFNFDKFVNRDMQKYMTGSPDEMIDRLEASVKNPSTPSKLSEVALGELMVHGEDVRRANGDRGDHPAAHVAIVGPMYAASKPPIGGAARSDGLSFRATDSDWTLGTGPEIAGPGIDLVLAISGRGDALDACEGDGLATLRARC